MKDIWVHQLSPFVFEIYNGIGVRWYGLAYIATFVICYWFVNRMAQKGRLLFPAAEIQDFVVHGALGTLIGGRLGYVLFYSPELLGFTGQFPYWGVLAVHRGGMASHGGIAGIIVGVILFSMNSREVRKKTGKWFRFSPFHAVDLTCFAGPLGVFIGRIANFINGELYGRECPPDHIFAVKFPSEIYRWGFSETDKLQALGPAVEKLGEITAGSYGRISATADLWRQWVSSQTSDAAVYIDYFKEALVLATQNGNSAVAQAMGVALTPRYPSQLFQAVLEGLLIFLIFLWLWRKPLKPGTISACFAILYPIARFIGEQYRLPDAHIGYQWLGLTRGQWLSVAMFVMLCFYIWRIVKSKHEPV